MKKELKFFDEEHVGDFDIKEIVERLLQRQKQNKKPLVHVVYITATPMNMKTKKNKEKV